MSGGGSKSTTTTNNPPAYLEPYLRDAAKLAQNSFYGRGGFQAPEYYPGSTVTPFSPETQQALQLQSERSMAGSPLVGSAQNALQSTLQGINNPADAYLNQTARGDYLTGGTGFDAALQAATNKILPQVGSAFGGAGRLHSGLAQTAASGAIGDAFANLYGQERANQLSAQNMLGQNYLGGLTAQNQAAALSPTLANQDYYDIGQLANVGTQKESLSQQQLQDQINRYNFYQNRPYQMLQNYSGLLQGTPAIGGSSVSTAPSAGIGQNLLGGGLAGAGMWSMLNPGMAATLGATAPWALGGAALMGLLG